MNRFFPAIFMIAASSGIAHAQDRDAILVSEMCDMFADSIQADWAARSNILTSLEDIRGNTEISENTKTFATNQYERMLGRTLKRLERQQISHANLGCEYVIVDNGVYTFQHS